LCVCVDLLSLEGWRSKVLLTIAQVNRYSMSFSITAVMKNKMIKSPVRTLTTAATLHLRKTSPKNQSINHLVRLSSIHLRTSKRTPNQYRINQNIRSNFLSKFGVGIVRLHHRITKLQNPRCQYRIHLRILLSFPLTTPQHQRITINPLTKRINHWTKVNPITKLQQITQKIIKKSAFNHNPNRDSITFQIVILLEKSWSYSKQQRID